MYSKEEKKQLVKDFWSEFDKYSNRFPELKGKRKKWILLHTGIKGLDLKFDPGRDGVSVILELNHPNEEKRLAMYERIQEFKLLLEDGFEEGLKWEFFFERESNQQVCRVYTSKEGLDLHRRHQWPEIFEFMAVNMLQLQNNYLDFKDVIKEEFAKKD